RSLSVVAWWCSGANTAITSSAAPTTKNAPESIGLARTKRPTVATIIAAVPASSRYKFARVEVPRAMPGLFPIFETRTRLGLTAAEYQERRDAQSSEQHRKEERHEDHEQHQRGRARELPPAGFAWRNGRNLLQRESQVRHLIARGE